jgi:hypothetical protein
VVVGRQVRSKCRDSVSVLSNSFNLSLVRLLTSRVFALSVEQNEVELMESAKHCSHLVEGR